MVAELVGHAQRERHAARVLRDAAHELGPVPARGEVPLVGLGDELHDARQVGLVDRADVAHHVEACQVVVEGGRAGLQVAAFALLLVLGGARGVFGGERDRLEPAPGLDGVDGAGAVGGDVDHLDVGQRLTHLLALGGVVVDEHEAVQAQRELLGHARDGVALGLPRRLKRGDVVEAQHHRGVLQEGAARVVDLVLAGDGEQHAALGERLAPPLERTKGLAVRRLAERHAERARLSDDAAPQRVVQVEHQHLLGAGRDGAQGRLERARELYERLVGQGLVGPVPAARLVEALAADARGERLQVDEVGAGREGVAQGLVGRADETALAACAAAEERAERAVVQGVGADHDQARAELSDASPAHAPELELVGHAGGGGARGVAQQPLRPGEQHDDVGVAGLHGQQVLPDLIVAALGDDRRLAASPGDGGEHRHQEGRRPLADQADAQLGGWDLTLLHHAREQVADAVVVERVERAAPHHVGEQRGGALGVTGLAERAGLGDRVVHGSTRTRACTG